jgi:hypothetical protein
MKVRQVPAQCGSHAFQVLQALAAFCAPIDMLLNLGRRHGVDLAIEVGLHA